MFNIFESNSFFIKQFDILSEEPSQCRSVPAYMAPGGGSDAPKPKTGYPPPAAEVEHIPFFWDAPRTKNAQSSKCSGEGYICTLQQVPTSSTHPKTFHFWNRVPFHFFGPKIPKSRPESTLFEFHKLKYFQLSSSRGLWALIWEVFFSNFWKYLKF